MATAAPTQTFQTASDLKLWVRRLEAPHDAERAFATLYRDSKSAFWLDSSAPGGKARFSFIGDSGGRLGALVTYDVEAGEVRVKRGSETELRSESIFDYLGAETTRLRSSCGLPFHFNCGFIGYFGYELKADCDGDAAHRSRGADAAFIFAARMIAFDHLNQHTYLLCLARAEEVSEAESWIEETRRHLSAHCALAEPEQAGVLGADGSPGFELARPRRRYLADIAACKQRLFAGETYEVCLTNKITTTVRLDPLSLYRTLRRIDPAPFGAFLRFGDLAVLSSSPERFLAIDPGGRVEARPIKGTSRRGQTVAEDRRLAAELRADPKSRAEHLTIVDLLRNDLGRVCEFGTVQTPELLWVESYQTVHQLVSTVAGRLRAGVGAPQCIRACFPPGSMTGAPKKRTMEIIDELEGEPRGIYSGAIGYLGLGGGCDLSVVIRTIVIEAQSASIGVGGAIVVDSDPQAEYEETQLKGRAAMQAILGLLRGSAVPVPQP